MRTHDRFAPPKAALDVDGIVGIPAPRKPFPWLFVLRYVVGAFVLVSALISLFGLSQSWAQLTEHAVIDPIFSPWRFLPTVLLKAASGIALLARRKLALALTLLWLIAFLHLVWGNAPLGHLAADFSLNLATLVAILAFQCLLLTRGLLR